MRTKKKDKYWMRNLSLKKGAFTKQAKRHRMSVKEYADYVIYHYKHKDSKYNPTLTTYRRALLTKQFLKANKKKKTKH